MATGQPVTRSYIFIRDGSKCFSFVKTPLPEGGLVTKPKWQTLGLTVLIGFVGYNCACIHQKKTKDRSGGVALALRFITSTGYLTEATGSTRHHVEMSKPTVCQVVLSALAWSKVDPR